MANLIYIRIHQKKSIVVILDAIMEYGLILSVILMTGGILPRILFGNQTINILKAIIMVNIFFIIVLKSLKRSILISQKRIITFLVFFSFLLTWTITNKVYAIATVWHIMIPILEILLLSLVMTKEEVYVLASRFIKIVYIIAMISLFFYLFGSVLKIIHPTGNIVFEWDKRIYSRSFLGLYYDNLLWQGIDIFGIIGYRNCSIFAEAPMYTIVIMTAYFLNRTYCHVKKKYNIIFIITIFTIFSTTGYIALITYEGINFIFYRLNNKKLNCIKNFLIPFLIFICWFILNTILESKSTTGSFSVRIDHLNACIKTFFQYIPFGCGTGNTASILENAKFHQGISVGLIYFFAQGGIIAVLIFTVPISCFFINSIKRKSYKEVSFCISYFIILFLINITFNSMIQWFIWGFIFVDSGYRNWTRERYE